MNKSQAKRDTASCWQGIFYCEDMGVAGTMRMTVKELRALDHENPDYWLVKT